MYSVHQRLGYLAAVVCLAALPGCYRVVVAGQVLDNQGQALPGIAVSVDGTEFQDVTNTRGEYAVRFKAGKVRLRYAKTGYTGAELDLVADGLGETSAKPVHLWQLPPGKGVYLYTFENAAYSGLDSLHPEHYVKAYGTAKWPELTTEDAHPRLIAHRVSAEGVSLVRLQLDTVEAMGDKTGDFVEAWVPAPPPAQPIPLKVLPLDPPAGSLLDLRYEDDLEPGTYAVDWNALSGNPAPEPLIYYFRIEEPLGVPLEQPASETPADEKANEDAGDKPKKSSKPEASQEKPDAEEKPAELPSLPETLPTEG